MEEQKLVDMVRGLSSLLSQESEAEFYKTYPLLSEYMEEKAEELYDVGFICVVCIPQLKDYIDAGKPRNMINYHVPKIGEDVSALIGCYLSYRFGEGFDSRKISDEDARDVARLLTSDLKKIKEDTFRYAKENFGENNTA
jgi:hypothetical protein